MEHIQDPGGGSAPQRRFQPTGRQIASAALIALVLLFGLINLDKVGIDFVVTSVRIPLVFVIIGSSLLGVVAGVFFQQHREHRKRDKHDD